MPVSQALSYLMVQECTSIALRSITMSTIISTATSWLLTSQVKFIAHDVSQDPIADANKNITEHRGMPTCGVERQGTVPSVVWWNLVCGVKRLPHGLLTLEGRLAHAPASCEVASGKIDKSWRDRLSRTYRSQHQSHDWSLSRWSSVESGDENMHGMVGSWCGMIAVSLYRPSSPTIGMISKTQVSVGLSGVRRESRLHPQNRHVPCSVGRDWDRGAASRWGFCCFVRTGNARSRSVYQRGGWHQLGRSRIDQWKVGGRAGSKMALRLFLRSF